MKKALITGITGQDGSYLAEFLLDKGYAVHGIYRRISNSDGFNNLDCLVNKINLVEGDLTDSGSLNKAIKEIRPNEIYNLGAQSFVPASWTQPLSTVGITGVGVLRLLEAIRNNKPDARFYQAGSSEMFGLSEKFPQNEQTPFHPRSPYAFAKVFGHHTVINYRESFGLYAANGILFNHESPRRGMQFVTRKISNSVARIKLGKQKCLELGNIDAKRDWGHAKDYVESMWLMLQQDKPDDYVVATGENHTIREFVEESFDVVGMDIKWEGKGISEIATYQGEKVVGINPKFYRPAEVYVLLGDSSKFRNKTGWRPKTSFKDLVSLMVEHDLRLEGDK